VLGAVCVFLAVSVWWLAADNAVLDWDSGRHVWNTWAMRDALGRGDLLAPITQENLNGYPPLLYVVGSIGMALGGWRSVDAAMLAMNVVFVPLLALGCWAAARRAYGELAGVLAAIVALGAPIVVSTFHLYMLDVPQAALVAVSVALLLESRRFERTGIGALAGLAGGAAMLVKPTTAIALAGLFAAVLARGGWRQVRGVAAFLAAGAIVATPWYIAHFSQLHGVTVGATSATAGSGQHTYVTPPRRSVANWLWYGWDLLNVQLLAPLFVCFVCGMIVATIRFWRDRSESDPTPELLAGGLICYLGLTFLTLKDVRYSLPALVYVVVLAVGWVPALRGRVLRLAVGAVVLVALVNLIGVSGGIGSRVAVTAPDHPNTVLGERSVRLYSPEGFIRSSPRDDGDVLQVMKGLRAAGFRTVEVEPNGDASFSVNGLEVLLRIAGLEQPPAFNPTELPSHTPMVLRHPVTAGGPRPCGRVSDGEGVYVVLQRNVMVPFDDYKLICPRAG
jgi:4-amino-4-deoxy-L-arabinose transferase-like glycosyltransferase